MKRDNLLVETIMSAYSLFRSKLDYKKKLKVFWAGILLTARYYIFHKFIKSGVEHILGFTVSFFDYGILHFQFREIFFKNEYYFKSTKKNPVYLDCGANIGMATIYFKWLYPNSVIYAFEPDPITFELLQQNIKNNHFKNVHLFNVALSDKKGTTSFYINRQKPGWLTMSLFKNRMPHDKITVKCMPLSFYLINNKVDFMTLDIEGGETAVMKDLDNKKIMKNIKEMVVEYHYGLSGTKLGLTHFLRILKDNSFHLRLIPAEVSEHTSIQDILIYARL